MGRKYNLDFSNEENIFAHSDNITKEMSEGRRDPIVWS